MAKKILEIACFNLESVKIAAGYGADRIELCENYNEGGITPSDNLILEARKEIKIPLHVIIRPRPGNFVYTTKEFNSMKEQIVFCKMNGIDGVVFGILTSENKIHIEACKTLRLLAGNMPVTFHRAIDQCVDIKSQLKHLIDLNIERVLTSGGKKSALDGIGELKTLQKLYGQQIAIMPGGGVRSTNLQQLMETGCYEFHSAAITDNPGLANTAEIKKLKTILS